MDTPDKPKRRGGRPKSNDNTQIIGFRLPKDMALEVKLEATERRIALKDLFAEMWERYKKQRKS